MEKQTGDKRENNLVEGSILKSIIFLSIPIIIGNLLQTAYNIIDTFWVGRLGAEAVAAVSLSFPIIFLIIAFSGGIGLAGAVLVAQYKGKGDDSMISKISGQTLIMAFVASIIASIIGYFLTPSIVSLFGVEQSVVPGAVSYLKISFLGLFFVFGYMVFQSLIRGVGDAKTPAYIVLGTVLLNAILDPLFIFGWGFIPATGVAGAAWATLFTQGIALLAGMFVLFRRKSEIKIHLNDFKPEWKLMKKIINLGVPVSFEQSSRSLSFIVMTLIVTSFGTVVLASYGIGMRIFSLVIIPALSLSIANSTLVGQNIGAGKIDRAEKITRKSSILGFFVLSVIGILFFIFARQIISIFIPSDLAVIESGALFLKTMALSFGLIGIQMSLYGTFRGSGNTKITMNLAIFTVVIQVLLAIVLSKYTALGEFGLWLAFPVSNLLSTGLTIAIFARGKWKEKKIIEPETIVEESELCREEITP